MSQLTLAPMPRFREVSNVGAPLAGGKLYTAQPGTVAGPAQAFPKATYSDDSGTVANTNPIIMDASGRAGVWLSGAYSMALYDSNDVLIYSEPQVYSGISTSGSGTAISTTVIFGDATLATYNVSILAATDPAAPDVYEISKTDASANFVHITPATGTVLRQASFDLENQGESIRLKKYANLNDWMKG
jgi:hypothetical protein